MKQRESVSKTRVAWYLLVATIVLTPLATSLISLNLAIPPLTMRYAVVPKLFCLVVLSVASLATWMGVSLGTSPVVFRGGRILAVPFTLAVLAVVSTLVGIDPVVSVFGTHNLQGLLTLLSCIVVFFLVTQLLDTGSRLVELSRAVVVSGALIALASLFHAVAAFFDRLSLPPHVGEDAWSFFMGSGIMGNPDFTAAYLCSCAVVAWGLWLSEKETRDPMDKRWALISLGAACLMTATTVITRTRASLLGLLVGLVMLCILLLSVRHVTKKTVSILIACLSVSLIVGFIIGTAAPGVSFTTKLLGGSEQAASLNDYSGGRLILWKEAFSVIGAHPLTGTGPDLYQQGAWGIRETIADSRTGIALAHEDPHNYLLSIAATLGIPAMILGLGFCGYAGITGFRRVMHYRSGEVNQTISTYAAWLACSLATSVNAFFASATIPHTLMLLCCCAVIIAPTLKRVELSLSRLVRVTIALCAGVLCIGALYCAQLMLSVDRYALLFFKTGDDAYLSQAYRKAPWDYKVQEWYLSYIKDTVSSLTDPSLAFERLDGALEDALERQPYNVMLMRTRNDAFLYGNERGFLDEFATAQARQKARGFQQQYPRLIDLQIEYAMLSFYAGDQAEAFEALAALPRTVRGDVEQARMLFLMDRRTDAEALVASIQQTYPVSVFLQQALADLAQY